MTLYTIEFEVRGESRVERVVIASESAYEAIEEFRKTYPDSEIAELRRTGVR